MIGIRGFSLSSEEADFIRSNRIGFVILFSRNYSSPLQFRELTDRIHGLTDPPPLIFIDQEGGPVVRLGEQGSTVISAMGLAASARPSNALKAGKIIGREMKSLGIDGVFAPVADVNTEGANPVIGIRSFSDDPDVVSVYAAGFFRGLKKGGVIACGKHFPGHGHTREDSHLKIPESDIDEKFFYCMNIPPFRTLIRKGIPSLMTAHVRYPRISSEIGTFSPLITGKVLRGELNFGGVLFSDCMEMKAVMDHYTLPEIIQGFAQSSLDVMTVSHSLRFQSDLLFKMAEFFHTGRISRERIQGSLERIGLLKKRVRAGSPNQRLKNIHLRRDLGTEQRMAQRSITVIRDRIGLIPLRKTSAVLLIDLAGKAHPAGDERGRESEISRIAGEKFFSGLQYVRMSSLDAAVLKKIKEMAMESSVVIVIDHSACETVKQENMDLVAAMTGTSKDVIIVCANSPYAAESFREAGTIVLTYGSRQVQMEALFEVLSGKKRAKGRLPVTVSEEFKKGCGI